MTSENVVNWDFNGIYRKCSYLNVNFLFIVLVGRTLSLVPADFPLSSSPFHASEGLALIRQSSQCHTADCPFTAHYVASNRSAASVTAVYLHKELKTQTGGQLGLILTHWNTHCCHQHSAYMMQMNTDRTSSGVQELSASCFGLGIKDISTISNLHGGDLSECFSLAH